MPIERLQPQGLKHFPLFMHVIKAGDTVYIAGQVALDQDGQVVGPDDITAQATQVFEISRRPSPPQERSSRTL